jgi:6-phosphofructokinase
MGLFDMAKKIHPDSKVYGFLAGPHGVFTGNYIEITEEYMGLYRNMGGFDMIRAGRHKIESPEENEFRWFGSDRRRRFKYECMSASRIFLFKRFQMYSCWLSKNY